jgi:hypothetical protein
MLMKNVISIDYISAYLGSLGKKATYRTGLSFQPTAQGAKVRTATVNIFKIMVSFHSHNIIIKIVSNIDYVRAYLGSLGKAATYRTGPRSQGKYSYHFLQTHTDINSYFRCISVIFQVFKNQKELSPLM